MARAKLELEFELPKEQAALDGAVTGKRAVDTLMNFRAWLHGQLHAGSGRTSEDHRLLRFCLDKLDELSEE